jgi:RpiB/LacA/LacB family sugar-phosphate isomerase
MRIAIGSDHAGYALKQHLRAWLAGRDIQVHDVGPDELDPTDDYPDFAVAVARSIQAGEADLGVLICATGVGSCIAANKLHGIRAALVSEAFSARMSRLHNDANVLCLGANVIAPPFAEDILASWLDTSFSGGERHCRRLSKIARIEASQSN